MSIDYKKLRASTTAKEDLEAFQGIIERFEGKLEGMRQARKIYGVPFASATEKTLAKEVLDYKKLYATIKRDTKAIAKAGKIKVYPRETKFF